MYLCCVQYPSSTIMAKITKQLSSKVNQSERSEILIRFVGGQHICLRGKTGIFIKPTQWNESKKDMKSSCLEPGHTSARNKIQDLESYILTSFENDKYTRIIDSQWLKDTIFKFHNPNMQKEKSDLTFEDVYNKFIDDQRIVNTWTDATVKKHRTTLHHLLEFEPKISLPNMSKELLSRYLRFLRDSKKMLNTTAEKQIGYVKWFLRWAYKNGYTNNNSCDDFEANLKKKKGKPEPLFLTWDELMAVYKFDFSNDVALSKVRDVFCFCAFTSLRHSDVFNLKWENINLDDKTMKFVTVKTDDEITIELNKYALAILEKYKDGANKGGKALPVISDQKMNKHLKELGKRCGLDSTVVKTYFIGNNRFDEKFQKWELLTTHCGRRTFICNALSLGIPPDVVMKWTGHSDYKAMRPYIDVADKTKAMYMDRFNQVN